MKFAIMTGGGDSPGMNAFVRAVVRSSLNLRNTTSVWGVIDGWRGLIDGNFRKLSSRDTAGLAQTGGSILGTMRVPELATNTDMQEAIAMNLHDNYFDYLFVIGGNGSLRATQKINQICIEKNLRTKILFTPGSIDNDVCNKYGFSVGFYSSIEKSKEMLEWIRDTASAHRRVYIIKSMGRDSGYLAFYAGIATGAEHIILPGEEVNFEQLATIIDERDRDTRILVAEGYQKSVNEIREKLESIFEVRNIKHEIRTVDMSYFQRGGQAAVKDILLGSWLGYCMVWDAYDKKDSAFYIAFYGGEEPSRLTLDEAVGDDEKNNYEIPDRLLAFFDALR
jgi:6-phosphofructokinase 1